MVFIPRSIWFEFFNIYFSQICWLIKLLIIKRMLKKLQLVPTGTLNNPHTNKILHEHQHQSGFAKCYCLLADLMMSKQILTNIFSFYEIKLLKPGNLPWHLATVKVNADSK